MNALVESLQSAARRLTRTENNGRTSQADKRTSGQKKTTKCQTAGDYGRTTRTDIYKRHPVDALTLCLLMPTEEKLPSAAVWLGMALVSVCFVVTVTGDCLVYSAFFTRRNVRSRVNVFFLSLTTADLCLATLVMTIELVYLSYESVWPLGVTAGKLWNSLFVCFGTASVCSLMAISADRYLVITRPLSYHDTEISNKSLLVLFCLWIYAFSSGVYSFFIWIDPPDPGEVGFYISFPHAIILMLSGLSLPFAVCVCLYYRIYKISIHQSSQIASLFIWKKEENRLRIVRERKSAKTLGLLVGTFALCTLPFSVFHVLDMAFNETLSGRETARHVVKWLCYVNSASNWALYGFLDRVFRDALQAVMKTCRPCARREERRIVPLQKVAESPQTVHAV